MTVTTKRDSLILQSIINKMRAGPNIALAWFPKSLPLTPEQQNELADFLNEQAKQWCVLWFIAELDGLLPKEFKDERERQIARGNEATTNQHASSGNRRHADRTERTYVPGHYRYHAHGSDEDNT